MENFRENGIFAIWFDWSNSIRLYKQNLISQLTALLVVNTFISLINPNTFCLWVGIVQAFHSISLSDSKAASSATKTFSTFQLTVFLDL